jgi:hypothetical protein
LVKEVDQDQAFDQGQGKGPDPGDPGILADGQHDEDWQEQEDGQEEVENQGGNDLTRAICRLATSKKTLATVSLLLEVTKPVPRKSRTRVIKLVKRMESWMMPKFRGFLVFFFTFSTLASNFGWALVKSSLFSSISLSLSSKALKTLEAPFRDIFSQVPVSRVFALGVPVAGPDE